MVGQNYSRDFVGQILKTVDACRRVAIAMGIFAWTGTGFAATYNWSNLGNDWGASADWTPNGIPTASDTVQFIPLDQGLSPLQPLLTGPQSVAFLNIANDDLGGNWNFLGVHVVEVSSPNPSIPLALVVGGIGQTVFNGPSIQGTAASQLDMAINSDAGLVLTGQSAANNNLRDLYLNGSASLIIDNSAVNLANRLSVGQHNIFVNGGATINLLGNAAGTNLAITSPGDPSTTGMLITETGNSHINIDTPAGATGRSSLTFNALNHAHRVTINFSNTGSGTLGGTGASDPRILFTNTPQLTNGVISDVEGPGWALYNNQQFASYDNTRGVVAATTTDVSGALSSSPTQNLRMVGDSTIGSQPVFANTFTIAPSGGSLSGSNSLATQAILSQGGDHTISVPHISAPGVVPRYISNADPNSTLSISSNFDSGESSITFSGPGTIAFTGTSDQIDFNHFQYMVLTDGTLRARIAGSQANFGDTSDIRLWGGVFEVDSTGVSGGSSFTRSLGLVGNQVNWSEGTTHGSGGFSAYNGPLTVNLGGSAETLTWGGATGDSQYFVQDGQSLIFGSTKSNSVVDWKNPINLDSGTTGVYKTREIKVIGGVGGDKTIIDAPIGGSATTGLTKTGTGTLQFGGIAANTYQGLTTISAGTLELNSRGSVAIVGDGNTSTYDVLINGGTLKWLGFNQITGSSSLLLASGAVNLNGAQQSLHAFTNTGGIFTTGNGGFLQVYDGTTTATTMWSAGSNTINSGGDLDSPHIVISGGTNTVEGKNGTAYSGGSLVVNSATLGGAGLEMTGSSLILNSDSSSSGTLILFENNLTSHAASVASSISSGGSAALPGTINLYFNDDNQPRIFTVEQGTTPSGIDLDISAKITNGGLIKTGAGTLRLTGANDYAQGTTVSAGTLMGDTNGLQGSITNNATVVFDQTFTGTYFGQMSGAGTLTKQNTGTVTFSGPGSNTYTGLTMVSAGTLQLAKAGYAISGNIAVTGGTLRWFANNQVAANAGITMTSGAVDLNGQFNQLFSFTNAGGTFTTGQAGSLYVPGSIAWIGGTNTVNLGTSSSYSLVESPHFVITGGTNIVQGTDFSGSFPGALFVDSGGAGLEMAGANLSLFSAANSGGTLFLNGNVIARAAAITSTIANAGLSPAKGIVSLNGGFRTFMVEQGSTPSGIDLDISAKITNGGLIKTGSGTLRLTGANDYNGGTVISDGVLEGDTNSLQGNFTNNAALIFDQTFDGQYSGVLSGNGTLTKKGAGTIRISGNTPTPNTYTGLTTVSAGTLLLNKSPGTNAIAGNIYVNGGALKWMQLSEVADSSSIVMTSGTVDLNGNGEIVSSLCNSGGSFTTGLQGYFQANDKIVWSGGTNVVNIDGIVVAPHIDITGGLNTVQGSSNISQGNGYVQILAGGAGLEMTGSTLALESGSFYAGDLWLSPMVDVTSHTSANTSSIVSSGAGTNIGYINLFGDTHLFTIEQGTTPSGIDLDISARITGGGLIKAGAGTLRLTGPNDYAGGTTVNAGTLMGDTNGLQGAITNNASLVFDQTLTGTYAGAITGPGTLTKQNSGTVIFTSANSVGNLNVTGGTLEQDSGTLTVASGGITTLSGGTLTINGGAVDLKTLVASGGSINFTSGSLSYIGDLNVGVGGLLGSDVTLNSNRQLRLTGTTEVSSAHTLTVSGGSLNTGNLVVDSGATFSFTSGTVGITGAGGLTIGSGGPLGASMSLAAGQTLNVINATTINTGSTLSLNGGTFNTGSLAGSGAFNFNSGTLGITGAAGLAIGASGPLGNTIVLGSSQALNVTNTLTIDSGAKLFAISAAGLSAGHFVNNGDLIVSDSTVAGPVVNNSAVTVLGTANFSGLVSGPGNYFGPGVAHFNGGFSPGASPAAVSFEGSAALGTANVLTIELGGLTQGTQFDHLNVNGQLSLGGTLHTVLYNGFMPHVGDSFDIFDWGAAPGSLSGTFSSVTLPALSGAEAWDASQLYTTGTLSVVETFLPGDFNRDGHVNAADILPMEQAMTNLIAYKATYDPGITDQQLALIDDINGDGSFNNADLQSFLDTLKSGGGSTDPVPEPASIVLLSLGTLAIAFRRRIRYQF